MSGRETFLARWSRRKQAAVAEPPDAESTAASAPVASEEPIEGREPAVATASVESSHEDDAASAARGSEAIELPFDPASLPPIESIVADTDIRTFLAPGVPPELTHAALRRAWAADPKIRDFVGLADYDWDFNAPGSMAGFGPLEMTEELRQIAARIIGPPPVAEPAAGGAESSELLRQVGSRGESPSAELIHDMSPLEADAGDRSSESDPPLAATQSRMRPKSHNLLSSRVTAGPYQGNPLGPTLSFASYESRQDAVPGSNDGSHRLRTSRRSC
jgi:hypothetical protein